MELKLNTLYFEEKTGIIRYFGTTWDKGTCYSDDINGKDIYTEDRMYSPEYPRPELVEVTKDNIQKYPIVWEYIMSKM